MAWRAIKFLRLGSMLLLGDVLIDRLRMRRPIPHWCVVPLTRSERLLVRRARRGDDFAARAAAPRERFLQRLTRFALRRERESEAQQSYLRKIRCLLLQRVDRRTLLLY